MRKTFLLSLSLTKLGFKSLQRIIDELPYEVVKERVSGMTCKVHNKKPIVRKKKNGADVEYCCQEFHDEVCKKLSKEK